MQTEYTIQRLRGGYAVVWYDADGKRHREALAAPDRIGAQAEARQRWKLGDRSPWTVGRIVTAYIDDREHDGIASTQRQRDAWKAMKPYWQNVMPDLIDREMCKSYAAMRNRAPDTVRYELGMLSVALRWAKTAKHLAQAPEIWRPGRADRKIRHINREQFAKFLAAVEAPHARLYALLGIYTMARPTALLELTWDRIYFVRKLADLNPKDRVQTTKRRPPIALNDEAIAELKLAYEARQSDHVIEYAGGSIKSVRKAFIAASERCGIKVHPYTLRHTAAVWAAERNIPMSQLAQFMGHEDSRTTEKHYARYSPDFLRSVANSVQLKASA